MLRTIAPGIYTLPAIFSPEECHKYISKTEAVGYDAATVSTADGTIRDESIRNNSRLIQDDFVLAQSLWSRTCEYIPAFLDGHQAIGLNERFRYYRYGPGQRFAGHVDGVFRRENGEHSRLTFMVYLNDDFEGGETKFLDTTVNPQPGMALIFKHELFHEGCAIRSGRKYVLRSDVMFMPLGVLRG